MALERGFLITMIEGRVCGCEVNIEKEEEEEKSVCCENEKILGVKNY